MTWITFDDMRVFIWKEPSNKIFFFFLLISFIECKPIFQNFIVSNSNQQCHVIEYNFMSSQKANLKLNCEKKVLKQED